jgi:glycosyltransferase involved in cell wall biosynthesis
MFIVIPCFNEQAVLLETVKQLDKKFTSMIGRGIVNDKSKVLFVDDGSTDKTWEIICEIHSKSKRFTGLCLSCNKGQQNATYAGLMAAKSYADVIITMDADLQDDIDAVENMLDEFANGHEVIFGVRSSRKEESRLRRIAANSFYKTIKLLGVDMVKDHSAYRLLSKRAVEALSCYSEVNLFLPGITPLLGFNNKIVYFNKKERYAGKSKYSIPKLFSLATEAITSFSLRPLRLIGIAGIFCLLIFAVYVVFLIMEAVANNLNMWMFVLASVWAIGGTILLSVSIVGEYIGKTYFETKRRPRYFISNTLLDKDL